METLMLPFSPRFVVLTICAVVTALLLGIGIFDRKVFDLVLIPRVIFGGLTVLGIRDLLQQNHAVLRNYPISAHIRFLLEEIRPEMRQYFFESEKDGMPFSRDTRAVIYQRAKMVLDKRPFGTQEDVYREGYEWMHHSVAPKPPAEEQLRISLEEGGDSIWESGAGYFGCRHRDGSFNPEEFARVACDDQIKMVELKISQGAKPGHGGVLPAAKVSEEISKIRGVAMGEDCISPASHGAFSTPLEMMTFIGEMRRLSGGKPAGFKLCIGHPWEFLAICKAMIQTGIYPDFIVVDGNEGGTGAAPLEFMDHMGMPMREGVNFVHNALIGINARDRIRIGAAGKIATAFDMARAMAIGADWCNSARGFMFSLGCIQSLSCHTDRCPTGVTTQDPSRNRALVVPHKIERVYNYHHSTLHALTELIAAAGLEHPQQIRPIHFSQRTSTTDVWSFAQLYPSLRAGELIDGTSDPRFRDAWAMARADSFSPAE